MYLVRGFFRLLAVAFTLVVSLFLLGVGLLAMGNADTLRFDVVPLLTGEALARFLTGMGILGLGALILLFRLKSLASWLLLLWNLAVVSILLCAVTRPSYQFDGMDHFENGVYFFCSLSRRFGEAGSSYERREVEVTVIEHVQDDSRAGSPAAPWKT